MREETVGSDRDAVTAEQAHALGIGVVNPFALVEAKLGKKVAWKKLPETKDFVKKVLNADSYEGLFDPEHNPLLFNKKAIEVKPEKEEPRASGKMTDASVDAPMAAATVWADPGQFITDYVDFDDPIQGSVGDCYFIAAMASVAWARTYAIAHHCRRGGPNGGPIDMVEFFDGSKWTKIEVNEELPLTAPSNQFIYARSRDAGEIWPAIYEKAYAKWKTNHTGERPDYSRIAGGDMVRATQELLSGQKYYYATANMTAEALWAKVRENSISYKTFNPMTAWTYAKGSDSPDKVTYSNANLVANHAYSVLGWSYRNDKRYIILRNPWGATEATLGVADGHWSAWDAPYYGGPGQWIDIDLPRKDGTFALRDDIFKMYFAGLGVVK